MNDTSELDAQLDDILNGFGLYSRWYGFDEASDTKGKHTSSTPTEAITNTKQAIRELVLSEIAQREQAAELRGRIDELDMELPKIIGYDVLWANPAIHQGVTARIERLELQATNPEKDSVR